MRKYLFIFLGLLAGFVRADIDFITSVTLSGVQKRDLTGVGIAFTNTTGTEVVITQLGRWVIAGNTQSHLVGIYTSNVFSSPAASVTIDTAGATPGEMKYETLSSPYVVPIGATIRIISSETLGGDYWWNGTVSSNVITITDIGTASTSYVSASTGLITSGSNNGGQYTCFGPVGFRYTAPVANWSKLGTVYTVFGPDADVMYSTNSAIRDASDGDTINIPAGTFTVGGSYGLLNINKAISVNGAGQGVTILNMAAGIGNYDSTSAILLNGGGSLGHFTLNNTAGTSGQHPSGIRAITTPGWRIHHVTYNSSANVGYGIYANAYGLYDHCTINGGNGQDEWVFVRQPTGSWTTPQSMGTASAVYGEMNKYQMQGYTDYNAASRGVVRCCKISPSTGEIKLDGHGYYTDNNPRNGVRHVEFYENTWTSSGGSNTGIELRGGGGRIFFNRAATSPSFYVRDYGYETASGNWGVFQTPLNYPLFNQIGTGQFVEIDVEDLVAYQRAQISFIGDTTWTSIGGPASPSTSPDSANSQFTATGPGTGTGRVYICPASEPMYIGGNIRNFSTTPTAWPRTSRTPVAGAINLYRSQTGNPAATFAETDIIRANRDFYATAGFDAMGTGVTIGTAAQMALATPTNKHAFVVTDEGTWNQSFSGTIAASAIQEWYLCEIVSVGDTDWEAIGGTNVPAVGDHFIAFGPGTGSGTVKPANWQVYVGNGSSWVLDYTPYTYPHPLQGDAPILSSASINEAGNQLTLVWTTACTTGAGGSGGVTVTATGGAVTATYDSGEDTNSYVYDLSRTISGTETVTTSYTQPGNGIESAVGGVDVESYTDQPVTNNSSTGAVINVTTLNVTNLIVGP